MTANATRFLAILVLSLLVGCVSRASSPREEEDLLSMLSGQAPRKELTPQQLAKIQEHDLGSAENPVRAAMPPGERAYLQRLRCPEGKAPTFDREGSVGLSPYGSIMDVYTVACDAPPAHHIYIDMYHPDHVELEAVPGFSIVKPDGT
jgi:hypothetical protein